MNGTSANAVYNFCEGMPQLLRLCSWRSSSIREMTGAWQIYINLLSFESVAAAQLAQKQS